MQHDAVSRWLSTSNFTPSDLWNHVKEFIDIKSGYLVCDDTLLNKQYSRNNELAKKQYSGNEHGLVNGICLVTLLWTDGKKIIPVDYRIYHKHTDDKTKNDHFQDMLDKAYKRGFTPRYVIMDSWYSSIHNLKSIRKKGWHFICNLKSNRKVSVIQNIYISISDLELAEKQVKQVWLKEYGYVLVCKIVDKDGGVTYLATSDISLNEYESFKDHWQNRWNIEEFHRGIKQTTGIEKCYSIKANSQRTHIFAAMAAFVKLENIRIQYNISWYEFKANICRLAVTNFLLTANA